MSLCRYVAMSLCRYVAMSLCRYVAMSLCRYVAIRMEAWFSSIESAYASCSDSGKLDAAVIRYPLSVIRYRSGVGSSRSVQCRNRLLSKCVYCLFLVVCVGLMVSELCGQFWRRSAERCWLCPKQVRLLRGGWISCWCSAGFTWSLCAGRRKLCANWWLYQRCSRHFCGVKCVNQTPFLLNADK